MLNHMAPAASDARLGDVLAGIIAQLNIHSTALLATTATGLVTTGIVVLPTLEAPGAPSIPGDYP